MADAQAAGAVEMPVVEGAVPEAAGEGTVRALSGGVRASVLRTSTRV